MYINIKHIKKLKKVNDLRKDKGKRHELWLIDVDLEVKNIMKKLFVIRTYAKTLYIGHSNFDDLHHSFVRQRSFASAIA